MGRANRLSFITTALSAAACAGLFGCSGVRHDIRLPHQVTHPVNAEQRSEPRPFDLMPASPGRRTPASARSQSRSTPTVRVSPDGKWIAFESDRGGLHGVWIARADGTGARRVSADLLATMPAWSPDGTRLAFAVEGDGVWMVWLADGRSTRVIAEPDVDAFAWAPGGRQIAFRNARDGQWKTAMVK